MLWYDDGRRYLPGDREPVKMVELRLPAGPHRVTRTPTAQDDATPRSESVIVRGGLLKIEVGSVPLFIEAAAKWQAVP